MRFLQAALTIHFSSTLTCQRLQFPEHLQCRPAHLVVTLLPRCHRKCLRPLPRACRHHTVSIVVAVPSRQQGFAFWAVGGHHTKGMLVECRPSTCKSWCKILCISSHRYLFRRSGYNNSSCRSNCLLDLCANLVINLYVHGALPSHHPFAQASV